MKCALFTFALLFTFNTKVFSQEHFPVNAETGRFSHSKVIFLDSTSKAELFARASDWLSSYFLSTEVEGKVIDEASGKISCKVKKSVEINAAGEKMDEPLSFALNIFVKGDRVKFEFTDMVFNHGAIKAEKKFKKNKLDKLDKQLLGKTKKTFATIEASLIDAMTNNSEDVVVRRFKLK